MPETHFDIKLIHETERMVVGSVRYTVLFDKQKGTYSCTCTGNAAYNKECKHIRGMREQLRDCVAA